MFKDYYSGKIANQYTKTGFFRKSFWKKLSRKPRFDGSLENWDYGIPLKDGRTAWMNCR